MTGAYVPYTTPPGDIVSDNEGLMAEFEEFLNAKRQREAEENASDEDVEIWDEKGRGARVKRSMAKPFLQSLGIDLDPPSDSDGESGGNSGTKSSANGSKNSGGNGGTRPTGKTQQSAPTGQSVRKYFTKPTQA